MSNSSHPRNPHVLNAVTQRTDWGSSSRYSSPGGQITDWNAGMTPPSKNGSVCASSRAEYQRPSHAKIGSLSNHAAATPNGTAFPHILAEEYTVAMKKPSIRSWVCHEEEGKHTGDPFRLGWCRPSNDA